MQQRQTVVERAVPVVEGALRQELAEAATLEPLGPPVDLRQRTRPGDRGEARPEPLDEGPVERGVVGHHDRRAVEERRHLGGVDGVPGDVPVGDAGQPRHGRRNRPPGLAQAREGGHDVIDPGVDGVEREPHHAELDDLVAGLEARGLRVEHDADRQPGGGASPSVIADVVGTGTRRRIRKAPVRSRISASRSLTASVMPTSAPLMTASPSLWLRRAGTAFPGSADVDHCRVRAGDALRSWGRPVPLGLFGADGQVRVGPCLERRGHEGVANDRPSGLAAGVSGAHPEPPNQSIPTSCRDVQASCPGEVASRGGVSRLRADRLEVFCD